MRTAFGCFLVILLVVSVEGGVLLNYNSIPGTFLHQVCEDVEIEIIDQIATTTVYARFQGDFTDPVDMTLYFPLPTTANVIGAETWVSGHWVDCSLTASIDTTDTGAATTDPDLNDYLGLRPFKLSLNEYVPLDVKVRFKYIELLKYDFGLIHYEYPWQRPEFLTDPVDTYRVSMSLTTGREILDIHCEHAWTIIDFSSYDGSAYAEGYDVAEATAWHITYEVASDSIGFNAMFFKDESDTGFFLFIIEPPLNPDTTDVVPKEFVFVLDKSGSMAGYRIIQAKEAADTCIQWLYPYDRFNIIAYNEELDIFSDDFLVSATPENKLAAHDWISPIDRGGYTNINSALLTALDMFSGERLAEIIFLTDGLPTEGVTDLDEILANVAIANDEVDAAICSFGIGSYVDSLFLKNLAFLNRGLYFFVTSTNIAEIARELFTYVNVPVLGNPYIEVPSITVLDIYPINPPAIFAGKQLIVSGRYLYGGTSDVLLHGELAAGDTTFIYSDIEFPVSADSLSFVPTVWAKQYIDYWIAYIDAFGFEDSIAEKIVDVALKYGIVCRYTEYISRSVVDEVTGLYTVSFVTGNDGIRVTVDISNPEEVLRIELLRQDDDNLFSKVCELISGEFYVDNIAIGAVATYKLKITYIDGSVVFSRVYVVINIPPDQIAISNVYPNPFNTTLYISITGATGIEQRIDIFDLTGRKVRSIMANGDQALWDGRDDKGKVLSSGVYLIKPAGVAPLKSVIMLK
ncbi:VWA domain-containing protein [bacterium]|nr:VWA domain-containing protein [bacterium]